jgi:recombination protein RecA
MSFPLLCAQTALGRPVGRGSQEGPALVLKRLCAMPQFVGVAPASRLEVKPAQEMVSSGIREMDALTGGLPRGCLSEICGPASSGRTCVLLAALAAATQRQEVCALVDTTDAFAPGSAEATGVDFQRLLWVRCGGTNTRPRTSDLSSPVVDDLTGRSDAPGPRFEVQGPTSFFVEQALRVTDLLLQSGGFGLVAIDLGDVPLKTARRIPLTSWFRFQRAVEHTPTVLLVVGQAPCAQTCASLLLKLKGQPSVAGRHSAGKKPSAFSSRLSEKAKTLPPHAQLLEGIHVEGEILRSRLERKPAGSVTTAFTTKAVRAG